MKPTQSRRDDGSEPKSAWKNREPRVHETTVLVEKDERREGDDGEEGGHDDQVVVSSRFADHLRAPKGINVAVSESFDAM